MAGTNMGHVHPDRPTAVAGPAIVREPGRGAAKPHPLHGMLQCAHGAADSLQSLREALFHRRVLSGPYRIPAPADTDSERDSRRDTGKKPWSVALSSLPAFRRWRAACREGIRAHAAGCSGESPSSPGHAQGGHV